MLQQLPSSAAFFPISSYNDDLLPSPASSRSTSPSCSPSIPLPFDSDRSAALNCYFSYCPSRSATDETPITPFSPATTAFGTATTPAHASPHPLLAERAAAFIAGSEYRQHQYPLADPLLQSAAQLASPRKSSVSKLFQLQTQAAYAAAQPPVKQQRKLPAAAASTVTAAMPERMYSSGSTSSSSSASSYSSRYSLDSTRGAPAVEVMRCSRCAKSVETISCGSSGDALRRVSSDDVLANGMVRFGYNLYYCERCARMVGYK